MTESSPFMTYKETCQKLNNSRSTVKRLVADGKLAPPVPNPVRPMFLRVEVDAYIADKHNGHMPEEAVAQAKPPEVAKRGRGRPRKDKGKAKRRAA